MARPRPVFPGRFLFITRRCTQRQFLLRPDPEVNNAFTYCLAEAAKRFDVVIVLSQMISNHQHTLLYDPHAREVEFREHFHKMLAKCLNAYRGRWENFWAAEEPCVVEPLSFDDLLDKLVYIATNPVKDGLVEKVHHWPGPNFLHALLSGKPLLARRPRFFFTHDGSMPPALELHLSLPPHVPDKDAFLAELERRVALVELACARDRLHAGRRVLGRRRVLRQPWSASPSSLEPRRSLRPRLAAKSKWARIAALQRNKEWEAAYRDARTSWLAGKPALFPFGTYWLRRFANVPVRPPPLAFL